MAYPTEYTWPEHYPEAATDFLEWLWGIEAGGSTYRPWHVLGWSLQNCLELEFEGESFWKVIRETWSGFDLIPHDKFADAFFNYADTCPRDGIPDRLTVYRGQDTAAPLGLSWTTDKAVAEKFARGNRFKDYPAPVIYSLEVTGPEIAFLCNSRKESEVVLFAIPDLSTVKKI